jgi:hypothetical protein
MTVDALRGLEAPLDCHAEWQRAVDELRELDLETEEDSDLAAGLLRKRPDGFAFNWGSKIILILEFTRAYNWRATWHTDMDQVKTQRYVPLRDKLSGCLPAGWTVDILPLSLGVRGSFDKQTWRAALERFNLKGTKATEFMTELTAKCLAEADEAAWRRELAGAAWIVDALLGTGAVGPPRGAVAIAITAINDVRAAAGEAPVRVLAVDLPSGLDADTGEAAGQCVRADLTATFVAEKAGFANPAAAALTGTVHVLGIGAPAALLRRFSVRP